MSIEYVELSLVVFGMIVANLAFYLRANRAPPPPVRMAEVVELARYRRR
jgi:hypothetical protein